MAPERLGQAFELDHGDRTARLPVETIVWVTPPTYTARPPLPLETPPSLPTGAPAPVAERQLRELGLALRAPRRPDG